jgi:tetratricopeptide (TPR) repeat protein
MATNNGQQGGVAGLQIQGGAAIVAPVSAFPNGVPGNALIVIPVNKPTDELTGMLEKGPTAVTVEQMWKLLGFNGPAVQVQDDQGRPIAIGLEDLLAGLDKHWTEQPDDLNRGRIYAQELLKHNRLQRAEQVLSKIVAKGGTGDDWLALGIAQLSQGSEDAKKLDKAEGTLKGAQNLMKENPYPSLHLAKLFQQKKEQDKELEFVDKALGIDPGCIDAWAYLFQFVKQKDGEDAAVAEIEKRAKDQPTAAPYIAVQGFYANEEETRDKALAWAEKATKKAPDDPLAILCLSALHGQKGDLESVIKVLQPHEAKMSRDVRLANNYFEALFQSRQIEKVTKLLNALLGSPNKDVKQFAMERTNLVRQYLSQQAQQLGAAGGAPAAPARKG